ncbi:DUF2285 domain-containing protein [Xanthobacter sediminis]
MTIVTAPPANLAVSSRPDLRRLPLFGEPAGDGFHATVTDGDGDHRLWFPEGDPAIAMAALIPFDAHFLWRMRSAMRLKRRLDGKPAGPWPREQRLTAFQLRQAALMLRAWDGVASGASRRQVAGLLLNPDVERLRALDWKSTPERKRLGRLLTAARGMIEGGYLRWLTPGRRGR